MKPSVSIFSAARGQIQQSILDLEKKLRQRREIDLEISDILHAQMYKQRLDAQREEQKLYWDQLEHESDLKYRLYIQQKLAEEKLAKFKTNHTHQQPFGQTERLKMRKQMMSKTVQIRPTYSDYNRIRLLEDDELVERYRDGSRARDYISQLDRYKAHVFGTDCYQTRRYFDHNLKQSVHNLKQSTHQQSQLKQSQSKNDLLRSMRQKQIVLSQERLINQMKTYQIPNQVIFEERKARQARIRKIQEQLQVQKRMLEELINNEKAYHPSSPDFENSKKTIKNNKKFSVGSPESGKLFTRSPYGRLNSIKDAESLRTSPLIPSVRQKQANVTKFQDPTFRIQSKQVSRIKGSKSNKQKPNKLKKGLKAFQNKLQKLMLPQLKNPYLGIAAPRKLKIRKQQRNIQKKNRGNQSHRNYSEDRSASFSRSKQRDRSINRSYVSQKNKLTRSRCQIIQENALKKIDRRLRLSEVVYKDSQWRNIKHELEHLFNTYNTEIRLRKEIKDKINQHPDILKKHQMVVE